MKKKAKRPKEDKTKYNKFKVKKAKAKAPKTLKKAKPKAKSTSERAIIEVAKLELVEFAFGNLEKKLYDLSINIEGEHDSIDTKIDRLTDKVSAFEKRFADSRVVEHMWYLESILKYCAENKKLLHDADARGRTFLEEIEGEMKARGIGINPNIHKQVLDEMADSYREEQNDRKAQV